MSDHANQTGQAGFSDQQRSTVRRWLRRLRTALILGGLAFAFVTLVPNDTPSGNSLNEKVLGKAKDVLFNYVAWELTAIGYKLSQITSGVAPYLDEQQRVSYVVEYLQRVGTLQQVEGQINAVYSNPQLDEATQRQQTTALRSQREALRLEVDQRQFLAEAIIESQIAAVLVDEGFGVGGEILPPVSAHITQMPMLLVVSPRDRIKFDLATNVLNLSADKMTALEAQVDSLSVSSLVTPIGGLGLYPSMVAETWSPVFLFETVAHEWSHNYLYLYPLGYNYLANPETRIINETTASLFGREIGRKALIRYYSHIPSISAQIPPALTQPPATPPANPSPPADPKLDRQEDRADPFSFGGALHQTRITVDYYLALGQVELAERYMEQRRLVFAAHGINLRKLNQAWFAFYGGYQDPGGTNAGGQDPTGAALATLRARSSSLKAWIETVREVVTRDQLLALRDQADADN